MAVAEYIPKGERVASSRYTEIVKCLNNYATAQVTFQISTMGGIDGNTSSGKRGYADNFRNLHYGVSPYSHEKGKPAAMISREMADAFVADSPITPTVDAAARPAGKPVPFAGYVFVEDPAYSGWDTGYALFAVPAAPESGKYVLWISQEAVIHVRKVKAGDFLGGKPRADLRSPLVAPGDWSTDLSKYGISPK